MKASIDIGSNTVLLLVAERDNGQLDIIHEDHQAPRLGEGVDESRHLSTHAMERVITVLQNYQKLIADSYPGVNNIQVTATSAVRDARNKSQFLDKVKQQTGLEVCILSGLEEAQYTYTGALSVLDLDMASSKNVVIDIGGGSTEIAVGSGAEVEDQYSFDMGCVRFTERYLKNDPLSVEQICNCREAIGEMLTQYEFDIGQNVKLIGVAGTVTSLAFIDRELEVYKPDILNDYTMTTSQVEDYITEFRKITSEELKERYPTVMEERADIFRAGLLILEGFMNLYSFNKLTVSTGGLRHGAILKMEVQ